MRKFIVLDYLMEEFDLII